ncbi:MAG: anthranilate synthase component I family protein [Methylococcales bacterium]|nr:anthranilate synthase component I family protein [Methylococcales bacterium]
MKIQKLDISWINDKPLEKVIAHDVDSYKLFAYIKTLYKNCYLFESLSLPKHQDRYFTIGFEPSVILAAKGNTLSMTGEADYIELLTGSQQTNQVVYETPNPYHFIKENFKFKKFCKAYQGGLIGYLSHEAVNYFESTINLKEHEQFSTFKFGLYLDGYIFDTTTGTLTYYSFHEDRYELAKSIVDKSHDYQIPTNVKLIAFKGHSETKEEFISAVTRTKEKIKRGYSFQSEVGFKSFYDIEGDKIAIYSRLREVNPSPYMFYIKFDEEELLGASPEILISYKDGVVLTTPTAGTIVRGENPSEDVKLARKLLSDPKEIAEHNMLVDLHRNDMSRVCNAGSVKVSDLMYIIKFSHVQHIVSNVIGLLSSDKSAFDVLSAILPGGVVTGAPKIETLKIISENESTPRGPYGGAIGRFSFSGECNFCLPIRGIFCVGDVCYAQTSAGIVYDSVPEKEYIEVKNKLAAMKQTLEDLGAS